MSSNQQIEKEERIIISKKNFFDKYPDEIFLGMTVFYSILFLLAI